ncbi:MAG TPA: nuclear transport factor 2 family protein [Acidimicrobiales bacterium]|nr:nuclear transport factor 2 family protein [Acidimicrobiales bacterium]
MDADRSMEAERIVRRFLDAVEARDLDALAACFSEDARYQNVPHEPAVGPDAIRRLFAPILARSEAVRWELVNAAYRPGQAFLERVDRFVIDGTEYAVACNGVYELDEARGLIIEVRDYVDLGPWRERLAHLGL